jgi:hypothetical protein
MIVVYSSNKNDYLENINMFEKNTDEWIPKIVVRPPWIISNLPLKFPYRKPKRMVPFTMDPKLECYELAGPIHRFHYDQFQEVE